MTHEKVRFFSAHQVSKIHKKYLEWQKNAEKGVFDAKNHEESIGHDFKALSQAIWAEIENLCKLPSELHFKK